MSRFITATQTTTLSNKTLASPKLTTGFFDTNGNELFKITATSSAVNEFTITNAATLTSPVLSVTGGDTHISLDLDAKGTAVVRAKDTFVWGTAAAAAAIAYTTAGARTITAAEVLYGITLRDPNGGGVTDTAPTAALLVAAIPGARVGDVIPLRYINNADANEAITIAAGANGTLKGQAAQTAIAQNTAKTLYFVLTAVTGTETYDLYVA